MFRVLAVTAGSHSLGLASLQAQDDDVHSINSAHVGEVPGSAEATQALEDFVSGLSVDAVGHRLVHGGTVVTTPTVVDDALVARLRAIQDLAPLHVPPALDLLEEARKALPDVPHLVCPDNAFHANLPIEAAMLPLPASWRERWGLRRYGFHGLSYAWASRRAAELLGRPLEELNLVLAHLGGGASVCAVAGGHSVDTTMGFTPLDGIPMSTRSGGVDPGMLLWLLDGRLDRSALSEGLEHESGLLGLSGGISGDTRELVASGDPAAATALAVYAHAVRRGIAAMAAALPRLDALVFTGEIGWDQPEVRQAICAGLPVLGIQPPAVASRTDDGLLSAPDATVPLLVVEVQEERQIALEVAARLQQNSSGS
jgi:acetate kinase